MEKANELLSFSVQAICACSSGTMLFREVNKFQNSPGNINIMYKYTARLSIANHKNITIATGLGISMWHGVSLNCF